MKYFIAIIALATLAGCGSWNRFVAHVAAYDILCVKETGVKYVQFPSGAAVLLDKDGNPVACN